MLSNALLSSAAPECKTQVDVTTEDQQMINKFARLNLKADELQEKYQEYKRQLENLDEAENELALFDDDDDNDDELDPAGDQSMEPKPSSNIQFQVGGSFLAVTKAEVDRLIEERIKELKKKTKDLEDLLAPMKEEMAQIKSKLYAKFGSNINLDSDEP